jgi:hypothetical protein
MAYLITVEGLVCVLFQNSILFVFVGNWDKRRERPARIAGTWLRFETCYKATVLLYKVYVISDVLSSSREFIHMSVSLINVGQMTDFNKIL